MRGRIYRCRLGEDGKPFVEEVSRPSASRTVRGSSKESKMRRSLEHIDPTKPQVITGNLRAINEKLK